MNKRTSNSTILIFRKKRSDTKIDTIEKKYGKDYGIGTGKKLGNFLREKGYSSLSELLALN